MLLNLRLLFDMKEKEPKGIDDPVEDSVSLQVARQGKGSDERESAQRQDIEGNRRPDGRFCATSSYTQAEQQEEVDENGNAIIQSRCLEPPGRLKRQSGYQYKSTRT